MLTSLDLLVILFMGLAFLTLLALSLMFLIRNKTVRYVCMGVVLLLTSVVAFFGFMVGFSGFFVWQMLFALMTVTMMIASIVLAILGNKHPVLFLIARIVAAAALVVGFLNAIM